MKNLMVLFGILTLLVFGNCVVYGQLEEIKTTNMNENGEKVYTIVEKMPEFPGGQSALFEWLSENIDYPAEAHKAKREGRVIAQFVVNKDGHISNAVIIRDSVENGASEEVLALIKKMPNWIPGAQGGENVNVMFTLPITFKL